MSTAAGLALWAHELVHQDQERSAPDFMKAYNREERRRRMAGQDIMGNVFEAQAYREEARVYYALIARGFPKGNWVPLGVEVFGSPRAMPTAMAA